MGATLKTCTVSAVSPATIALVSALCVSGTRTCHAALPPYNRHVAADLPPYAATTATGAAERTQQQLNDLG